MSDVQLTSIPERIYFRIGDVAEILKVKPYVIRFWESEFPFLSPQKSNSGQRVFRRSQIEALIMVKHLLHVERYSIEGAKMKISQLRKESKLREFMDALIMPSSTGTVAPTMQVGSKISKEAVPVLALTEKINELKRLIRHPKELGVDLDLTEET